MVKVHDQFLGITSNESEHCGLKRAVALLQPTATEVCCLPYLEARWHGPAAIIFLQQQRLVDENKLAPPVSAG